MQNKECELIKFKMSSLENLHRREDDMSEDFCWYINVEDIKLHVEGGGGEEEKQLRDASLFYK